MTDRTAQAAPVAFTLTSAGRELGLAPSTVLARVRSGELHAERDHGRWVIYLRDIQDYRAHRSFRPSAGQSRGEARSTGVAPLTAEERDTLAKYGIHCEPEHGD